MTAAQRQKIISFAESKRNPPVNETEYKYRLEKLEDVLGEVVDVLKDYLKIKLWSESE